MDWKIIWAPSAHADLKEVVGYISRDNPEAAARFGERLLILIQSLTRFPERGLPVPEFEEPTIREVIFGNYRVIYELSSETSVIEISRIWHGARGTPILYPDE